MSLMKLVLGLELEWTNYIYLLVHLKMVELFMVESSLQYTVANH